MDRDVAEEIRGLRMEMHGIQTVLRTEIDDVKRHTSVVAESLRTDIRTLAEGFFATNERIDRLESRMREGFDELNALLRLGFGDLDRRLRARET